MDIYDQHQKAFTKVSAYVILNAEHERVATVAIKFPADGAGRLWAYCHVIGLPMQRAYAGGYGYDKRSPAVRDAFTKSGVMPELVGANATPAQRLTAVAIMDALAVSDGEYWDRLLEKAGFIVLQAV